MKLEGSVDHGVMAARAQITSPEKVHVRMEVRMRLDIWKDLSEQLVGNSEPSWTLKKLIDCTIANAEAQITEIMEVGEEEP